MKRPLYRGVGSSPRGQFEIAPVWTKQNHARHPLPASASRPEPGVRVRERAPSGRSTERRCAERRCPQVRPRRNPGRLTPCPDP